MIAGSFASRKILQFCLQFALHSVSHRYYLMWENVDL